MSLLAKGKQWEHRAETWLAQRGLVSLARNFNCRLGELDLVMRDGDTTVFVEVRYRGPGSRATALETVTRQKQLRVCRAAGIFLGQNPHLASGACRFDVVAFEPGATGNRVRWVRNAFDATLA